MVVARKQMGGGGLRARLIQAVLGSAGIQATNRVLALGMGIILARMLGPEGYGVYAYAFAIMGLLSVVAEAGVPTLLMREVSAAGAREQWGLLRGALHRAGQFVVLASITVSLVGGGVMWSVADSLPKEVLYTTALMLLLLPVSALCKTVAYSMMGMHRVVIGQALEMLVRPLLVLIIITLVFFFWPALRQPYIAMSAQLVVALVVLLVGALLLFRFLPIESRKVIPEYQNRQWLKSALPFTLIGGAGIINNQADIIMLGWFASPEDIGIYRVAVQVSTLVAFGLQAVSAVVTPQFAKLYAQGDMLRLQRLVTGCTWVILAVALPLALAFIFAGGMIVDWVFGAEYVQSHLPLGILAVGQLSVAVIGLTGPLVSMTGFEKTVSIAIWASALTNIFFNLFLIPLFGLAGAAAATATTALGWHVFLFLLAKKRLGIVVFPVRN